MKIYLVLHGEAKSKEENVERPLTENQQKTVENVSRYISRLGLNVTRIIHSGKLRIKQTAEIFVRYLSLEGKVPEKHGLALVRYTVTINTLVLHFST